MQSVLCHWFVWYRTSSHALPVRFAGIGRGDKYYSRMTIIKCGVSAYLCAIWSLQLPEQCRMTWTLLNVKGTTLNGTAGVAVGGAQQNMKPSCWWIWKGWCCIFISFLNLDSISSSKFQKSDSDCQTAPVLSSPVLSCPVSHSVMASPLNFKSIQHFQNFSYVIWAHPDISSVITQDLNLGGILRRFPLDPNGDFCLFLGAKQGV